MVEAKRGGEVVEDGGEGDDSDDAGNLEDLAGETVHAIDEDCKEGGGSR